MLLEFVPRLLPAPAAARYLGVSETTLRGLGIRRRILGGKKLYDRIDLDAYADSLRCEDVGERPCAKTDAASVDWGAN